MTPSPYSGSGADASIPARPEAITRAYKPLLERLEDECRQILNAAYTEADSIRTAASEEYHRIIAAAHRERSFILTRAADQQAKLYAEVDAGVAARLDELERQRVSILAAARAAGEDLRKVAINEARVQARSELEAAEAEVEATRDPGAPAGAPDPDPAAPPAPADAEPNAGTDADAPPPLAWRTQPDDDQADLDREIFGAELPGAGPAPGAVVVPSTASDTPANGQDPPERRRSRPFRRKA